MMTTWGQVLTAAVEPVTFQELGGASAMESLMRGVLVMFAVLSLLATGCGGDSVSAADFSRDGDALCAAKQAKIDAVFEEYPDGPSGEQVQDVVGAFVPILSEFHDGLEAIGSPEGKQAAFDSYVELVGRTTYEFDVAKGSRAKAEKLFNQDNGAEFGALERELGLNTCAAASG
jgi:hypothetical protein